MLSVHELCVQSYFKSNEDNFSIRAVPLDLESDIESEFNWINGAKWADIHSKFPKKIEISADRKVPKFITSWMEIYFLYVILKNYLSEHYAALYRTCF